MQHQDERDDRPIAGDRQEELQRGAASKSIHSLQVHGNEDPRTNYRSLRLNEPQFLQSQDQTADQ